MPTLPYTYYIYIVSNKNRTTFYIGVTNDIKRRMLEHKSGKGSSFTHKYKLFDLLYYEIFADIRIAIDQEKRLKNWHREWKINLIKKTNPEMKDIAADWFSDEQVEEFRKSRNIENGDAETSSA